ncbi:MAG: hypothetical protein GXY23_15390 [Myxococcales bacterium]|nr:hypothetical protein [Myxococcales bacterium]
MNTHLHLKSMRALAVLLVVAGCDDTPPSDEGDGPPLLEIVPEPAGATCAHGGHRVSSGLDANRNGVLDDDEVAETIYACHGAPGEPGLLSLVRVTRIAAGEHCESGGIRIEIGLDANRNGVLDDDEVDEGATRYLCDLVPAPCSERHDLAIAGDYVDRDGTGHWLRQTSTATTYAIVPGGPPDLDDPPELFEIARACGDMDRLVLRAADGAIHRLDYRAGQEGTLAICRRSAADAQAAIDATFASFDDLETGCDGEPIVELTLGGAR